MNASNAASSPATRAGASTASLRNAAPPVAVPVDLPKTTLRNCKALSISSPVAQREVLKLTPGSRPSTTPGLVDLARAKTSYQASRESFIGTCITTLGGGKLQAE